MTQGVLFSDFILRLCYAASVDTLFSNFGEVSRCVDEIDGRNGTHFDSRVLKKFARLFGQFLEVSNVLLTSDA
jgi:hypothetical protein